ncbi:MAG TPA: hypothetical protein VFA96_01275 [Nocardioides sp.]|nr:hypothetical protein [Nocardioides sp.]
MSKCPICLRNLDTAPEYYAHLEGTHGYSCHLVVRHTWHVARVFVLGVILAVVVWVATSFR